MKLVFDDKWRKWMYSTQSSSRNAASVTLRVFVNLQAKYVVVGPANDGYSPEIRSCVTRSISATRIVFEGDDAPAIGANVHLTIATLGAWPARVSEHLPKGFAVIPDVKASELSRLSRQLDWFRRLQSREAKNRRAHQRFVLPPLAVELLSQDGKMIPATLSDLSCSGAGVRVASPLPLGTSVELNGIRGRVARCFEGGLGIRFEALYSLDEIKQKLLARAKH